uniref:Rhodanese domain-containing protein n=1 Tax=Latimeria chalumnae TaxID=7897 RepID=M3XJH8_LATCH
MSARRSIGDTEFLKKRIPQNPKYQHVRSRLDTGYSMSRYMERVEEIKRNYRYRKDELFKRIKVTTFAQLVIQVASVSHQNDLVDEVLQRPAEGNPDGLGLDAELLSTRTNGKGGPDEAPSTPPIQPLDDHNGAGEPTLSPRSTLQSVISGVGELDLEKETDPKVRPELTPSPRTLESPYQDCPFLLLDVRDRDAYEQCHIIGGKDPCNGILCGKTFLGGGINKS